MEQHPLVGDTAINDADETGTDLHQPDADLFGPEVEVTPRRMPKWPFIAGGLLLLLGFALFRLASLDVPYFALSPGPVTDVGDVIAVETFEGEDAGELFFLTVSLKEITALEYIAARLDREVDLAPRENIRPAGVSQEELTRQNLDLMQGSQRDAVFVALTRLGFEPTLTGNGAIIQGIIEGTAADGALQVDDVIIEVNGAEVEFVGDAVEQLAGLAPGTTVTLKVERIDQENAEIVLVDLSVTLGPFLGEDEDGNPVVDEERGMIGVLLGDFNVDVSFPIDVEIDSQNIGGPSAGMMFTLEIMNQITEDDMTKGTRIAGTGTIDREGNVGAIGGVRQKVFGAINVGASYVLVPSANYDDALDAAGDDITVVEIVTIDDALAFLETLPDPT